MLLRTNNSFDWDNVKIMDRECTFHKRFILEMIHIKEQKNGLNLNSNTELLDESYFNILNGLALKHNLFDFLDAFMYNDFLYH